MTAAADRRTRWWVAVGNALLMSAALLGIVATVAYLPPAKPALPWACPRSVEGGWELVSFKVRPDGSEFDCRFVKRGVR